MAVIQLIQLKTDSNCFQVAKQLKFFIQLVSRIKARGKKYLIKKWERAES